MSKESRRCESFRAFLPSVVSLRWRRPYTHFRLDRQGLPVSLATLRLYEHTIGRFLRWVRVEHLEVRRFEDLEVVFVRQYAPHWPPGPG